MKIKRGNFNSKPVPKVSTTLQKNLNIKNREQLRRKLKDLLEKDKSLVSNKTKINIVPGVIKTVNKNTNVVKNQTNTCSEKTKNVKKKKNLKNEKNNTLKRKQNEKEIPSGKNKKVCTSSSQKSSSVIPPKINKSKPNKLIQSTTGPEKVKKKVNNIKSSSKPQKKTSQIPPKVKTNQLSPPSSVQQQKLPIAEKKKKFVNGRKRIDSDDRDPSFSSKLCSVEKKKLPIVKPKKRALERKQNDCEYKGPLRPKSPGSSEDESHMHPREDDLQSESSKSWENTESDIESESLTSSASIADEDFVSSEYEYDSDDNLSDYETDSESEDFQMFSEDDTDSTYKLPNDVPEDIYVAKGAAIKHDLSESNNIGFDSDDSCPQIIEIGSNQQKFHNALTWNDTVNENQKTTDSNEKEYESTDSCPMLVPIEDDYSVEDGYDYEDGYDDEGDYDEEEDCDDEDDYGDEEDDDFSDDSDDSDSCSDCLMHKYTNDDISAENTSENLLMVPEVFKADTSANTDFDGSLLNASDMQSEPEVKGSPLERIANNDSYNASYNVITVKNKNKVNHRDRKEDVLTNSKIEKIPNGVIDSHENSFNCSTDNIKSVKHPVPVPDLVPEMALSKTDITATKNNEQSRHNNSQDFIAYQENTTSNNGLVGNKNQMKTLFFNAINSNQVIVLLKDPLFIYGTLKLKLVAGGLDIFGYNPKPNEILEIFSPRGYGSLKIEPSLKFSALPIDENELNAIAANFLKTDIENVRKNYDCKHDAIIILERNDNSNKVSMLRKYMVENLFPNMNLFQSDRPFYTSEFLLRCVLTPTTDKPLIINPKWRSIPLNNSSRIMVIGGKSVGKTTLVRFLSNLYLNKCSKVLLLDLDIGQPEMFVPQTVSATTLTAPLLGPGYLSVKEPDKAFLVGHINVVLLPQQYIQSVQALISFCRNNADYENIPWIVNTMGYNKGFGDEIISIVSRLLNPTNIVQLESRNEINNFDVIMSKENLASIKFDIVGDMFDNISDYNPDHVFNLMSSVVPPNKKYKNDWDLKPRDMRLAMIISRLSAVLKGQAEWLTDIKPVCASTDDLKFVNLGDEELSTEDLLKGLVGNLVYLCKHNSSSLNECIGIGIVRGIDFPLKQIYLLPAIPIKLLKDVNCLALCAIPLPSSILINQGPKVKGVASYVYNTINQSASMHIKQIYNRPQHFLTGKFKTIVE